MIKVTTQGRATSLFIGRARVFPTLSRNDVGQGFSGTLCSRNKRSAREILDSISSLFTTPIFKPSRKSVWEIPSKILSRDAKLLRPATSSRHLLPPLPLLRFYSRSIHLGFFYTLLDLVLRDRSVFVKSIHVRERLRFFYYSNYPIFSPGCVSERVQF